MVNKINYIPQPQPINQQLIKANNTDKNMQVPSFADLLYNETQRQQPVKLSAHAQKRLQQRSIVLGPEVMSKINHAVQRAEAKGAQESLLIYGDLALIANVRNKTVVTAIDGQSLKDHVFTNIDSAVIIK
ncbi:TIGR02530 family flagellar biosynthesis protein [Peptococcaceae bacterium 1198_IL3148]